MWFSGRALNKNTQSSEKQQQIIEFVENVSHGRPIEESSVIVIQGVLKALWTTSLN